MATQNRKHFKNSEVRDVDFPTTMTSLFREVRHVFLICLIYPEIRFLPDFLEKWITLVDSFIKISDIFIYSGVYYNENMIELLLRLNR